MSGRSPILESTGAPLAFVPPGTQTAHYVLVGPTSGAAALPTFRLLVIGDIPDLSSVYQLLDGDLTAIAALTTTAYGRALLELANGDAVIAAIGKTTLQGYGIVGGTLTAALLFSTDNTIDIGAVGATRPRNIYIGNNLIVGDAGTNIGDAAVIAGTISARNGTTAQSIYVYNTYTNAGNYERGVFGWAANVLYIGEEHAGHIADRDVVFLRNGTPFISLKSTGVTLPLLTTNGFLKTSGGTGALVVDTATHDSPFIDSTAIIKGSADATKLLRFEVDGFTTGTTRVLTPPNYDGTVATLAGTETLTNKTITGATALSVRSAGAGNLALTSASALTADHQLQVDLMDSDRALTLGGDVDFIGNFAAYGDIILHSTGSTDVTLPATGTVAAWVSVPATASSSGVAGQIARDTGFLYVCVATNTWKRTALSTW